MDVKLAAEFARGGELTGQHFHVGTCDSVGIAVERVPRATDGVVNGNVSACESCSGIEVGQPRVCSGLNCADGGLSCSGIGNAFKSDGDPAVVSQVGIDRKQQAVDAIGCTCAQGGVIEVGCGVDEGGVRGVTRDGGQKVRGRHVVNVQTGCAVARQVGNAESTDEQADVFGDHFNFKSNAVLCLNVWLCEEEEGKK